MSNSRVAGGAAGGEGPAPGAPVCRRDPRRTRRGWAQLCGAPRALPSPGRGRGPRWPGSGHGASQRQLPSRPRGPDVAPTARQEHGATARLRTGRPGLERGWSGGRRARGSGVCGVAVEGSSARGDLRHRGARGGASWLWLTAFGMGTGQACGPALGRSREHRPSPTQPGGGSWGRQSGSPGNLRPRGPAAEAARGKHPREPRQVWLWPTGRGLDRRWQWLPAAVALGAACEGGRSLHGEGREPQADLLGPTPGAGWALIEACPGHRACRTRGRRAAAGRDHSDRQPRRHWPLSHVSLPSLGPGLTRAEGGRTPELAGLGVAHSSEPVSPSWGRTGAVAAATGAPAVRGLCRTCWAPAWGMGVAASPGPDLGESRGQLPRRQWVWAEQLAVALVPRMPHHLCAALVGPECQWLDAGPSEPAHSGCAANTGRIPVWLSPPGAWDTVGLRASIRQTGQESRGQRAGWTWVPDCHPVRAPGTHQSGGRQALLRQPLAVAIPVAARGLGLRAGVVQALPAQLPDLDTGCARPRPAGPVPGPVHSRLPCQGEAEGRGFALPLICSLEWTPEQPRHVPHAASPWGPPPAWTMLCAALTWPEGLAVPSPSPHPLPGQVTVSMLLPSLRGPREGC